MSFNEKLQKLRKENKYSQEELADLLDVTRQSVSKWESGLTYPEMDKLLAICKIFNCSLEELTNDEVKEISGDKKTNFTLLIDSGLNFINKTYKMFTNMKFIELLKCLFIMGIVAIILTLFIIPIMGLEQSFYNMLSSLNRPSFALFFSSVFNFIINTAYGVSFLLLFMYIFKIGFLDKYEFIVEKTTTKETNDAKKNVAEEMKEIKEQLIVKNIKDHDYRIFKTLGSIAMFFTKFFLVFLSIPFLTLLFILFILLVINFYLISKGIFFVSIIFLIVFGLILDILIIEFLANFIFNKANHFKRMLITFIVGIAGLGAGSGILLLEISEFTYVDELNIDVKPTKELFEYSFRDTSFVMNSCYTYSASCSENVEYIIDNNLKEKIKIEVEYYKEFSNLYIDQYSKYYRIYTGADGSNFKYYLSFWLKSLKKKELYNTEKLYDTKIIVYSSKDNINKMKENFDYYLEHYMEEEIRIQELLNEYEYQIQNLYSEISSLQDKLYSSSSENEKLSIKVEELQNEINEYKQRIKDLLSE